MTGTYSENRLDPAAADFRYYVYSGGQHRSRGLELDLNGRLTPELALTASASLIDARIVDDPAYTAGNRLAGAPRRPRSAASAPPCLPSSSRLRSSLHSFTTPSPHCRKALAESATHSFTGAGSSSWLSARQHSSYTEQ